MTVVKESALFTQWKAAFKWEYVNVMIGFKTLYMEARMEAITFVFQAFLGQNPSYTIE